MEAEAQRNEESVIRRGRTVIVSERHRPALREEALNLSRVNSDHDHFDHLDWMVKAKDMALAVVSLIDECERLTSARDGDHADLIERARELSFKGTQLNDGHLYQVPSEDIVLYGQTLRALADALEQT